MGTVATQCVLWLMVGGTTVASVWAAVDIRRNP